MAKDVTLLFCSHLLPRSLRSQGLCSRFTQTEPQIQLGD